MHSHIEAKKAVLALKTRKTGELLSQIAVKLRQRAFQDFLANLKTRLAEELPKVPKDHAYELAVLKLNKYRREQEGRMRAVREIEEASRRRLESLREVVKQAS